MKGETDLLARLPVSLRASRRAPPSKEIERAGAHIGFHSAPDPEYLHPFCRDAVEVGYTIFEAHRRRGYAREALAAIMAWASTECGVRNFVASVSPENLASLGLIQGFQFAKVGSHIDELDGPEDIFLLRLKPVG